MKMDPPLTPPPAGPPLTPPRKVSFDFRGGPDPPNPPGISTSVFSLRRTHTRGHHLKIDKKRVTHQARLRFFSQRVVNGWNSLPSEVVSANTIQAFKAKLDKHLQLP